MGSSPMYVLYSPYIFWAPDLSLIQALCRVSGVQGKQEKKEGLIRI